MMGFSSLVGGIKDLMKELFYEKISEEGSMSPFQLEGLDTQLTHSYHSDEAALTHDMSLLNLLSQDSHYRQPPRHSQRFRTDDETAKNNCSQQEPKREQSQKGNAFKLNGKVIDIKEEAEEKDAQLS